MLAAVSGMTMVTLVHRPSDIKVAATSYSTPSFMSVDHALQNIPKQVAIL
jgi:hypothetical protein